MQSSKVRTGLYASGATKVYAARSASFAGAPRTKTSLLAKPASGWAFPCFHLSLSHRPEIGRKAPLQESTLHEGAFPRRLMDNERW